MRKRKSGELPLPVIPRKEVGAHKANVHAHRHFIIHTLRVTYVVTSRIKEKVRFSPFRPSEFKICATPNEERNKPPQDTLQARKQAHN